MGLPCFYYKSILVVALVGSVANNDEYGIVFAQQQQQESLGSRTWEHLVSLTKDSNGNPNPRLSCTEGYHHAAAYVSKILGEIGLVPLGDNDGTSYQNTVPGSADPSYCPNGMFNLIGMVPGTSMPDEYVVFSAHLDGPNNQNPQTQTTRGNQDTSNAYDDGAAVALGLAMAERLVSEPSVRSVIFLFDDGEEGWQNVGIPPLGKTQVCPEFVDTDWFQNMPVNIAYFESFGVQPSCENFPIGFSSWVQNPTIDLSSVKAAFFADPFGAPPNGDSQLAVIGGEMSSYGANGETFNDFIDTVWPADSTLTLGKVPRAAIEASYSSMDGSTIQYRSFCGSTDSCIAAAGFPSIWLAQPAFQKYHGGMAVDLIRGLFAQLYEQEGIDETMLPATAYFSTDTFSIVNEEALDALADPVYQLILNTANSESVSELSYDYPGTADYVYTGADADNLIDALQVLRDEQVVAKFPPAVADALSQVIDAILSGLDDVQAGLVAGDTQAQAVMKGGLANAAVGVYMAVDFFNLAYPNKEAYANQSVDTSNTAPESLPSTTTDGQPIETPNEEENLGDNGFVGDSSDQASAAIIPSLSLIFAVGSLCILCVS